MRVILGEPKWNVAKSIIRRVQEDSSEPPEHVKSYHDLQSRIEGNNYDLIILGDRLEDFSCLECIRRLKARQISVKLWVYGQRSYEFQTKEAGADDFYVKGEDSDRLSEDLSKFLKN